MLCSKEKRNSATPGRTVNVGLEKSPRNLLESNLDRVVVNAVRLNEALKRAGDLRPKSLQSHLAVLPLAGRPKNQAQAHPSIQRSRHWPVTGWRGRDALLTPEFDVRSD